MYWSLSFNYSIGKSNRILNTTISFSFVKQLTSTWFGIYSYKNNNSTQKTTKCEQLWSWDVTFSIVDDTIVNLISILSRRFIPKYTVLISLTQLCHRKELSHSQHTVRFFCWEKTKLPRGGTGILFFCTSGVNLFNLERPTGSSCT